MSPLLLFSFVIGYFLLLLTVAWYTGKNSTNDSFFIGNKSSNWMLVAFGMVGTSLSGVTFVSVPGAVAHDAFAYFQITIGYLLGYIAIAYILLPLYYRLNLTSIYNYLHNRLGIVSYKTGSAFFILSRVLGATARLYLVVNILQEAILDSFHIPFWLTTLIILAMILLYTYEGGVKTIVWTDTLQTTCMLAGMIICVIYILNALHIGLGESLHQMSNKGYSRIFFTDPNSKMFFVKQILAGAFITITMTGLDQEMMQKNISVKTLKDSQKNIISMSLVLMAVILIFLFLGGLLYLYADQLHLAVNGDKLFPTLALDHMPSFVSVIFIIALISALFPSADGAITALTSSFCIDILGMQRRNDINDQQKKKLRQRIHLLFAILFLLFVMVFKWVNDSSMIGLLLKVATYTYGPLLGLFTFGILLKRKVKDKLVPYICVAAPILCYLLDHYQQALFGSFEIGLEILIINGLITFIGLWLISYPAVENAAAAD
ncbi:MAG TPA: sodium:solute symporter [Sediminibacterium sp.]|nr:sodium:solute symporter [Sediminibacterium sp.]